MTPTISFTFPNAAEASTFFAALSEAFAKFAKTATAGIGDSKVETLGGSGGSGAVADLKEFLAEQPPLSGVATTVDAAAGEKKTRKPRAPKSDAQAPAEAPAVKADGVIELVGELPSKAVTLEQLRAAGTTLAKSDKGPSAVASVLKAFSAAKYPDVPADRWQELLKALQDALTA